MIALKTLCMFLHVHTSMQVVEKEYFSHGQPQFSFNFSFREDFVSLKIPEKGELGGWKISPFYDPKVSSLLYSRYLLHHSTAPINGRESSNGLSFCSFHCRSQDSRSTASVQEKASPNVNCFCSGVRRYHQLP